MVASLMRSTTSLMTSISPPADWYRSVNNSSITSGDRLPVACDALRRTSSRRSGLLTSAALAMNRSSRTSARAWARTPPSLAASSSMRRVSSLSRCGSPAISSNAFIVSGVQIDGVAGQAVGDDAVPGGVDARLALAQHLGVVDLADLEVRAARRGPEPADARLR